MPKQESNPRQRGASHLARSLPSAPQVFAAGWAPSGRKTWFLAKVVQLRSTWPPVVVEHMATLDGNCHPLALPASRKAGLHSRDLATFVPDTGLSVDDVLAKLRGAVGPRAPAPSAAPAAAPVAVVDASPMTPPTASHAPAPSAPTERAAEDAVAATRKRETEAAIAEVVRQRQQLQGQMTRLQTAAHNTAREFDVRLQALGVQADQERTLASTPGPQQQLHAFALNRVVGQLQLLMSQRTQEEQAARAAILGMQRRDEELVRQLALHIP